MTALDHRVHAPVVGQVVVGKHAFAPRLRLAGTQILPHRALLHAIGVVVGVDHARVQTSTVEKVARGKAGGSVAVAEQDGGTRGEEEKCVLHLLCSCSSAVNCYRYGISTSMDRSATKMCRQLSSPPPSTVNSVSRRRTPKLWMPTVEIVAGY